MENYELSCLISSILSEEEIKKIVEEINSFIQKNGGLIIQSEKPCQKTLAYPIKKQKEAFLIALDFCLEPEKIKELNQKLKKNREVLRFILSIKKHKKEKSSKITPRTKGKEPLGTTIPKETLSPISENTGKKESSSVKTTKEKERQEEKLKEIEEKLDEILKE